MIKKLCSLLFAFSLIATLPALSMKNETYPCDNCENHKEKLIFLSNPINKDTYCLHILCESCDDNIDNTSSSGNDVSWDCKHCSYLYNKKGKIYTIDKKSNVHNSSGSEKAKWIKENCADRTLLNNSTSNHQNHIHKATTNLPTNNSSSQNSPQHPLNTEDDTYPCDNCLQEKTELNYIEIESQTKKCDHVLCEQCDDSIAPQKPTRNDCCPYCAHMSRTHNKQCWQDVTQQSYLGISSCGPVSAKDFKENYPTRFPKTLPTLGMKNKNSKCDACTQKIAIIKKDNQLTNEHPLRHGNNKGIGTCSYVLCDTCKIDIPNVIDSTENQDLKRLYGNCKICCYFAELGNGPQWKAITYPCDNCQEKKQLLTKIETFGVGMSCVHIVCEDCKKNITIPSNASISTGQSASRFHKEHPNRIPQPITNVTISPHDPNDPSEPTISMASNKNSKWLYFGAAGVVCYAAYKAYTWYTAKDTQEDSEVDDTQEETKPAEQV